MKDRMNFFHVDQQLMPTGRGRRWRFGMQTHFRQGSSSGSIIDLPTLDASGSISRANTIPDGFPWIGFLELRA
jgi:hypothetical protein